MKELDYLVELNKKYPRYLYKYFGFRLGDIARGLGMTNARFSTILTGKRPLPKDSEQRFLEIFTELGIEAKTKDFKESDEQKWMRGYWMSAKSRQNDK